MCHTTAIWVTETYCASKTMERPKVGLTLCKQDFMIFINGSKLTGTSQPC